MMIEIMLLSILVVLLIPVSVLASVEVLNRYQSAKQQKEFLESFFGEVDED